MPASTTGLLSAFTVVTTIWLLTPKSWSGPGPTGHDSWSHCDRYQPVVTRRLTLPVAVIDHVPSSAVNVEASPAETTIPPTPGSPLSRTPLLFASRYTVPDTMPAAPASCAVTSTTVPRVPSASNEATRRYERRARGRAPERTAFM